MTRPVRVVTNLLVLAGTVLLCLLAAEGLVRSLAPQEPSWLPIYRRVPGLPYYVLERDLDTTIVTGTTHMRVRTDGDGLRVTTSTRIASADRPVLLALGDSFTFGQGVDYEDTFVARLEASIAPPHRVLDAGIGGHGPTQYLAVGERLIAGGLRPDIVVVGVFLGNDFGDCLWSKDVEVVDGILGGGHDLKTWLKRTFHLYRLVSKVYQSRLAPRANSGPVSHPIYTPAAWESGELAAAWPIFRKELVGLSELSGGIGAQLIVVVIPTEASVAARRSHVERTASGDELDLPMKRVMALLDTLQIAGVDLTDALAAEPTEAVFLRLDGHLTPLGHRLAAAAIAARHEALR